MASYDQVSLEARPRLPGDTETPVDIKEPSRVLVQGSGAFSLEGEVGRGDTQGDRVLAFRSPAPSLGCVSLWMGYISSESWVPICVEVSLWISQPSWRTGAPLGWGWQSLEITTPEKQSLPCARCQVKWIWCVLIMNEWLIATALENYDATSLTVPWSWV